MAFASFQASVLDFVMQPEARVNDAATKPLLEQKAAYVRQFPAPFTTLIARFLTFVVSSISAMSL